MAAVLAFANTTDAARCLARLKGAVLSTFTPGTMDTVRSGNAHFRGLPRLRQDFTPYRRAAALT